MYIVFVNCETSAETVNKQNERNIEHCGRNNTYFCRFPRGFEVIPHTTFLYSHNSRRRLRKKKCVFRPK
jgi:hypothetical protein